MDKDRRRLEYMEDGEKANKIASSIALSLGGYSLFVENGNEFVKIKGLFGVIIGLMMKKVWSDKVTVVPIIYFALALYHRLIGSSTSNSQLSSLQITLELSGLACSAYSSLCQLRLSQI